MPTHAELAGKLLIDAATFFRTLANQNAELAPQMNENATVFEQMADVLMRDPIGYLEGIPNGELAGRLLRDSATFFRTLAEQNEPIRDQMNDNANVYERIGVLVTQDPQGFMDG